MSYFFEGCFLLIMMVRCGDQDCGLNYVIHDFWVGGNTYVKLDGESEGILELCKVYSVCLMWLCSLHTWLLSLFHLSATKLGRLCSAWCVQVFRSTESCTFSTCLVPKGKQHSLFYYVFCDLLLKTLDVAWLDQWNLFKIRKVLIDKANEGAISSPGDLVRNFGWLELSPWIYTLDLICTECNTTNSPSPKYLRRKGNMYSFKFIGHQVWPPRCILYHNNLSCPLC